MKLNGRQVSLDVTASLTLLHEGDTFHLKADGSQLTVEAPSLASLKNALRGLPVSDTQLTDFCRQTGLSLVLSISGGELVRIEPDAHGNWIGRLAGMPGAEITLRNLLRAALG